MKKKPVKEIKITLTPEEYEQLRTIAKAQNRFICRQAAYWVKRGIREYPLRIVPPAQTE